MGVSDFVSKMQGESQTTCVDNQHITIPVEVDLSPYMSSSDIGQPTQVPGKQVKVGIQVKVQPKFI